MQELPPPVPPPQQSESCHVIVAQGKESRPSPAYQRVQKPVVAKHRNLRSLLITLLRTTRYKEALSFPKTTVCWQHFRQGSRQ
jgi:hypothetical protein